MRGFVRALSVVLVAAPALLLTSAAFAQERRVVTTEGADYFGADYDVRRDVELNACEAACIGDAQCQAFTYNPAAKWCFLKNGVGELRAVEGAISGRIVATAEVKPDVEAQRVSELDYLPQGYFDEARRFQGRLKEVSTTEGLEVTLATAQSLLSQGDALQAAELYRTALSYAPERLDLWTLYAETALRASSDDWEVQEKLNQDRTSAGINAYLRSVTPEERAQSLYLIGRALGERSDWNRPSGPITPAWTSSTTRRCATPTRWWWPNTASASSTTPWRPMPPPRAVAWNFSRTDSRRRTQATLQTSSPCRAEPTSPSRRPPADLPVDGVDARAVATTVTAPRRDCPPLAGDTLAEDRGARHFRARPGAPSSDFSATPTSCRPAADLHHPGGHHQHDPR
jgi:hypothetical protein